MRVLAAYRDLLGNRALSRLLGGEFVSAIGDWLYLVALLVVIYQKTGDPVILGAFAALRGVPYILLSFVAGVVADRVDRRLLLLLTDLARGACMLGMTVVLVLDGPILALMALAILAACFSTFFYPAIGAYVPNLVRDERQLGPANSAWASLDNLGFVVGPALGGLLVALGGTTLAFVINAATFLVIAAILWGLPPSSNVAAPSGSVATGSTEVAAPADGGPSQPSRRPLIGLAVLRIVDYLIFGGIGTLTVILATDILRAGPEATGYLNAAVGIGGVAGAVVAAGLVLRRSLRIPVLAGAIVVALGAALTGLAPVLVAAMVAIVLVSGGHFVLEVVAATIMQRVTTDAMRGRAVGSLMTVNAVAEAAGSFTIPVLVTAFGAAVVLGGAGVALLVASGVGLALIGASISRAPTAVEATVGRVVRLPLFSGVSNAAVERSLDRFLARSVRAGEVVVRQGEPADHFYVIQIGSFAVTQSGPDGAIREVRRLGPDDVFGELGLLHAAPRSATVTATTDGVLLVLDGRDFLDLVGRGPTVRGRLIERYGPGPASAEESAAEPTTTRALD
jgi:MFS family permease